MKLCQEGNTDGLQKLLETLSLLLNLDEYIADKGVTFRDIWMKAHNDIHAGGQLAKEDFREAVQAQDYAHAKGLLQGLEANNLPRAKVMIERSLNLLERQLEANLWKIRATSEAKDYIVYGQTLGKV